MKFKRLLALVGLFCCSLCHGAMVSLNPLTITAAAGGQFTVDVVVDGLSGGQLLGGFDLDVVFDPAVMAAHSVVFGSALGADGIDQFSSSVLSAGRIDFAAVSLLDGLALSALQFVPFTIAQLVFDALAPGASAISFDLITAPGLLFSDEFGIALPVDAGAQADVRVTAGGVVYVPEPGTLALVVLPLMALARRQRFQPQQ